MTDMNELIRGQAAAQRLELASERAKRLTPEDVEAIEEAIEILTAEDHGGADGGARSPETEEPPTMNERIRAAGGLRGGRIHNGELWTG